MVYGVGEGIVDVNYYPVDEAYIAQRGFRRGESFLVDRTLHQQVLSDMSARAASVKCKRTTGGSALNTLFHLARLGLKASMAPIIGDDEGSVFIREQAKKDRLDLEVDGPVNNRFEGSSVTVMILVHPSGERTMPVFPGDVPIHQPIHVNKEKLHSSKYFLIEGYLLSSQARTDSLIAHAKTAQQAGVRAVLNFSDLGPTRNFRESFARLVSEASPYMVVASREELAAFTGAESVVDGGRAVAKYGVKFLIVTDGGNGSFVWDLSAPKPIHLPAVKTTVVDTTGAGDVYVSGLLYGLVHDWSLEKSGTFANHVAAAKLTRQGAHMPSFLLKRVLQDFQQSY